MSIPYLDENIKLITTKCGEEEDYHDIVKYGVTIHTPLLKKFIELSNNRSDNNSSLFISKIREFNLHREDIHSIMDKYILDDNTNQILQIMFSSKFAALALILLTYLSDYNNIIINDNKGCIINVCDFLVKNLQNI